MLHSNERASVLFGLYGQAVLQCRLGLPPFFGQRHLEYGVGALLRDEDGWLRSGPDPRRSINGEIGNDGGESYSGECWLVGSDTSDMDGDCMINPP